MELARCDVRYTEVEGVHNVRTPRHVRIRLVIRSNRRGLDREYRVYVTTDLGGLLSDLGFSTTTDHNRARAWGLYWDTVAKYLGEPDGFLSREVIR